MKLASKLVGWHIEVRAEGQVEDALKRAEGLFAKKPESESPAPPEGVDPGTPEEGAPPDASSPGSPGVGAGEAPAPLQERDPGAAPAEGGAPGAKEEAPGGNEAPEQ